MHIYIYIHYNNDNNNYYHYYYYGEVPEKPYTHATKNHDYMLDEFLLHTII